MLARMNRQWRLSGKESACNAGDTGDAGSIPGWEDPLEEGMATHSNSLRLDCPTRLSGDRLILAGVAPDN